MVRIVASPRMASLTSLHLGGRALALATFESAADLETLPEAADRIGGRVAMLGGGTNILAADGELPVVLVRCGMDEAPAVIGEDGGLRLVRVGAGVKLPRLLVWCMKHGLSGLEGMAGVPGDVGGAVAGNAGAHGMDMGTVLRSVDVFSPDRGFRTLWREDVRCEYRFFRFEGRREAVVCDFRYRIGAAPGGTGSDTHGPARQYRTQAAGAAGPFVERGVRL